MDLSVVLFTSDRGITARYCCEGRRGGPGSTRSTCRSTRTSRSAGTPRIPAPVAIFPDDRYLRILDPWVALSTAAAVTSTIRLGTAVALPMEHDPITLAKTLATLDHLSGGRVNLGVGFGWNVEGPEDHGVPGKKRRTVLREYLELMQQLWTEKVASYDGEYAQPQAELGVAQAGPAAEDPDPGRRGWYAEELRLDRGQRRRLDHHADRDHIEAGGRAQHRLGRGRTRGRSPDRRAPDQSARTRSWSVGQRSASTR